MSEQPCNLAIETSGRHGSIALGRGDALLGARSLEGKRRHDVGLMPAIDALCREHAVEPRRLGEVYVSRGPGSFTGLRVGMAAAKMLSLSLGVRLVGVPTLDVLAGNAPEREYVAVCLNTRRQTMYCAVYRREAGDLAVMVVDASLRTVEALLEAAPRPLAIIAEKMPDPVLPDGVTLLPESFTVARAEALWRLGRDRARRGLFAASATLLPLYVREPEAVTLWNQRQTAALTPPN